MRKLNGYKPKGRLTPVDKKSPLPPFIKGGYKKSPFIKGGFRGILVFTVKLTALLLALFTVWGAAAVWAQGPPPPPLAPGVTPQWAPAPGNPRVAYDPNIAGDLFRYGRGYYYYYEGHWYRSRSMLGPWRPVRLLPRGIYRLHRSAFKHSPPW